LIAPDESFPPFAETVRAVNDSFSPETDNELGEDLIVPEGETFADRLAEAAGSDGIVNTPQELSNVLDLVMEEAGIVIDVVIPDYVAVNYGDIITNMLIKNYWLDAVRQTDEEMSNALAEFAMLDFDLFSEILIHPLIINSLTKAAGPDGTVTTLEELSHVLYFNTYYDLAMIEAGIDVVHIPDDVNSSLDILLLDLQAALPDLSFDLSAFDQFNVGDLTRYDFADLNLVNADVWGDGVTNAIGEGLSTVTRR